MSDIQNPFAASVRLDNSVAECDIPLLEPPQSVRFAPTAEAIAAFWSHRSHSSASDKRTRRNIMLTASFLVLTAPVTLVILAALEMIPPFIGAAALLYSIVIVLWFLNSLRRSTIDESFLGEARRLVDEAGNGNMKGERTMTLEAGGVRQQLKHGESFLRWEGYERIEHTDHYAFFYESSMTAVVVPRSAFGSQSQFLGFVRLAQRLWNEHRGKSEADQPSPKADAV